MKNQRLTTIRRARRAIEKGLQIAQHGDRLILEGLHAADRHLKSAMKFTTTGRLEFAEIAISNAATHLQQVLGRISILG